jgi:integrase
MATIQVRKAQDGTVSYRVRIQRRGYPIQSATFPNRKQAERYGRMMEGQIAEGRRFAPKPAPMTIAELIEKYTAEMLPRKAPQTQHNDKWYLRYWSRTLGYMLLTDITPRVLREQREALLTRMKPGSALRVLRVLSSVLTAAVKDFEVLESNPMTRIRMPSPSPSRTRYLSDQERGRLLESCKTSQNTYLYALVVLALYTGLRRRSLFDLTTQSIDLEAGTLYLPRTKTGIRVLLPLVGEALEHTRDLVASSRDGFLFPRNTQNPWMHYRKAWEFALKRAGITGATFHDLRRSVGSYLVQAGVDLYTVSRVLAHTDVTTTQIYAHLDIENLRDALMKLSERLNGK